VTANTIESFFAVIKHRMRIYQHSGGQHLHRYLGRIANRGVAGKRRTHRQNLVAQFAQAESEAP
jgi:hypothetical protein